jgi:hypothetical protein
VERAATRWKRQHLDQFVDAYATLVEKIERRRGDFYDWRDPFKDIR